MLVKSLLLMDFAFICFVCRLLAAVDVFEQKLIDSSLLKNSSTVILEAPLFAVAATLSCASYHSAFPGKSFSSTNSLPLSVDSSKNLSWVISDSDIVVGVDLPANFAEKSRRLQILNSTSGKNCSLPFAATFHVVRNGRLFQSASAEPSNLDLPGSDLSLADDLRVINSLVVSASITDVLNTSYLSKNMSFLLEEQVHVVRIYSVFHLFLDQHISLSCYTNQIVV